MARHPGVSAAPGRSERMTQLRLVRSLVSFIALILVSLFDPAYTFGQASPLQRGEELFLNDRMAEAVPLLESALVQYPGNERIYLYLATAYEVLGDPEKAITILQRGVQHATEYLDVMYFNIANNLFKQEKNVIAHEMYTKAINANPSFSEAYLNRANTALKIEEFDSAASDYELYLRLAPSTSQRASIEEILAILNEVLEEERRVAVEQERARVEEVARRKALLDQVLGSLQNASRATTNLAAESENVEHVDEKSDIVD